MPVDGREGGPLCPSPVATLLLPDATKYSDKEISGGASAAKESGHFEVRTSSSQVTRMHFSAQRS